MKVNMIIEVAEGKYCYRRDIKSTIYSHFDNEGGYASCDMNLGDTEMRKMLKSQGS